ncbi:hypothetical protein KJ785_00485 [Patescibacteria group bacterium]|nr:hypothetical protein [Patescibacteria group bacterium]
MKNASLKKKLAGMVLIIIIIMSIISIGVIYPSIKKILELKQGIESIKMEIEEKYVNSQKLRRTIRELEKIKEQAELYKQASVKSGDELKIITKFEGLAIEHNIDQTLSVSFSDGNTKDNKSKPLPPTEISQYYELSFINNGLFENHVKYLQDLEKLPYYVIIKNVKFEKRQSNEVDKNRKTPIILSFNVTIYAETK